MNTNFSENRMIARISENAEARSENLDAKAALEGLRNLYNSLSPKEKRDAERSLREFIQKISDEADMFFNGSKKDLPNFHLGDLLHGGPVFGNDIPGVEYDEAGHLLHVDGEEFGYGEDYEVPFDDGYFSGLFMSGEDVNFIDYYQDPDGFFSSLDPDADAYYFSASGMHEFDDDVDFALFTPEGDQTEGETRNSLDQLRNQTEIDRQLNELEGLNSRNREGARRSLNRIAADTDRKIIDAQKAIRAGEPEDRWVELTRIARDAAENELRLLRGNDGFQSRVGTVEGYVRNLNLALGESATETETPAEPTRPPRAPRRAPAAPEATPPVTSSDETPRPAPRVTPPPPGTVREIDGRSPQELGF